MSSRAGEHGFTLLEVLVAFAIAALALTVLFRTTGTGLSSTRAAARYEEAVVRARSHLAAIGRDDALQPGEMSGDDGGGFRWRISIRPVATAVPEPTGAAPGPPAAGAANAGSDQPPSSGAAQNQSPSQGQAQSQPTPAHAAVPPPTLFAVEVGIAWTDDGRKREVVLRGERLGVLAAASHG